MRGFESKLPSLLFLIEIKKWERFCLFLVYGYFLSRVTITAPTMAIAIIMAIAATAM